MEKSGWKRVIIVFLVWNIVLTLCIAGIIFSSWDSDDSSLDMQEKTKYTLYIGTNDKDTYVQEISPDEADRIVREISEKYTDGYTAFWANGGWVDDKGVLTQEASLVYIYTDISEETMLNIMDEILVYLNQNSILIERTDTSMHYYYGRNQ